ncbi:MAG: hypothetical protein GX905_01450 [Bacteroidales bacterium]|nr:hypothetical protein [Bacteroidales bacterium]
MKIVFFLQTVNKVNNVQSVFLDLAAYMADYTSHEVYYANNFFDADFKKHHPTTLKYVECAELRNDKFADAIFFTPVNYLCSLLSVISQFKKAKIAVLSYDAKSFEWLANTMYSVDSDEPNKLFEMVSKKNACAYFDYSCIRQDTVNKEEEIFIPTSLEYMLPDQYPNPALLSKKEINIGYYGKVSEFIPSFNNLLRNLGALQTGKNINFHVIGSMDKWFESTYFKNASTEVFRVIYVGEFNDITLTKEYVSKNVDILFATGRNAIEATLFGVPVVIPVIEPKGFHGDKYVRIFNASGYIYKWDRAKLSQLNNTVDTLEDIISDTYKRGRKRPLAKKGFEFVKKNASIENASLQLEKLLKQTQLTVQDCLANTSMKARINDYNKYHKRDADLDFNQYMVLRSKTPKKVDNIVSKEKDTSEYLKVQESYAKKISSLQKQEKIKVAFLVLFDTTFPTQPVFEKMMTNELFDPYVVVIPYVASSMKYQRDLYNKTLQEMERRYPGRVIGAYDVENRVYYDLGNQYSIVFFNNPYSWLVHPNHHIKYFTTKNCLTLFANYGFAAIKFWDEVMQTDTYNLAWKVCIENESNQEYMKTVHPIKGINSIVTGYFKMDSLADEKEILRSRKSILICPHHTITGWAKLDISNFLRYFDLFLKLPKLYPDIDFVFRPHPLLITKLTANKIWTQKQVDDYLKAIENTPNMTYDTTGYYLDKFVNSDAMIHDCASFMAEYLYTKKPCCYMMKTKKQTMEGLLPIGIKCINHHYHALTEEEIISFIDNVVIAGKDPLKEEREKFVETELRINYPKATEYLIDYIIKVLKK